MPMHVDEIEKSTIFLGTRQNKLDLEQTCVQTVCLAQKIQDHQIVTLATASSKSSCVTWTRRSRRAYIPASVHTP